MSNASERTRLGAEKIGTPVREIIDAIGRLAAMEPYRHIRFEAVDFYTERFLGRELISLIDESWDSQQLAAAEPDVIKVVFIMLLRDMMQAHRAEIVSEPESQEWDTQWIEQFIAGLFYETQAPMKPYQDWLSVVARQGEEPSPMLLMGLAKQLSIDPRELFQYQMAAREVTREEILA